MSRKQILFSISFAGENDIDIDMDTDIDICVAEIMKQNECFIQRNVEWVHY